MGKSNDLGRWGENVAARYLTRQGYAVVARNYRTRYGEIDLVAELDNTLVFAEVKLRKSARYGTPGEAVTLVKQKKLRTAALQYLQEHETALQPRFDVIEIYAPEGMATDPIPIRQIKDAF